jgi:hypothetical protein
MLMACATGTAVKRERSADGFPPPPLTVQTPETIVVARVLVGDEPVQTPLAQEDSLGAVEAFMALLIKGNAFYSQVEPWQTREDGADTQVSRASKEKAPAPRICIFGIFQGSQRGQDAHSVWSGIQALL